MSEIMFVTIACHELAATASLLLRLNKLTQNEKDFKPISNYSSLFLY